MTRRFADYDPFAWFYTKYWGEEFHREAMPVLDRLLLALLPARAEILDLCCGDGRIAQTLAKRGYRVTGIDGSERMLTYARKRVPKAELYLQSRVANSLGRISDLNVRQSQPHYGTGRSEEGL